MVFGASAGFALASGRDVAQNSRITVPPNASACILSPQLEEGPFYLDPNLRAAT